MPRARLYFDVDGKRLTLEEYVENPENLQTAQLAEAVVQTVGRIECPEHGEAPTVVARETEADGKFTLRFKACCEGVLQLAEEELQDEPRP